MNLAYLCVLVAAVLPYFWVVLAKSGPKFDNHAPRAQLAAATGWKQRAHWAHLNAFEAFPPFAAAVLVAHQLHADPYWINVLAVAFVVFRVLHGIFYIRDNASLRSLAFGLAFLCVVALFVIGMPHASALATNTTS